MRVMALVPCLVACGASPAFIRVDAAAYARVPATERAQIEQQAAPTIARARDELARADASLAATRKELDETRGEKKMVVAQRKQSRAERARAQKAGDRDDVMRAELAVEEADEGERVHAAKLIWLEKMLLLRRNEQAAAAWRLQMVTAKLELTKAERAAVQAPGDRPYDATPLRTQHGRMHRSWTDATRRCAEARPATDQALRDLMQAKTRYTEVQKAVLPPPALPPEAEQAPAAPPAPAAAPPRPRPRPR
jgi:hypothetical protein